MLMDWGWTCSSLLVLARRLEVLDLLRVATPATPETPGRAPPAFFRDKRPVFVVRFVRSTSGGVRAVSVSGAAGSASARAHMKATIASLSIPALPKKDVGWGGWDAPGSGA